MRTKLLLACGCLALGVLPLAAQPPAPKPGPEHELLKKFAGNWDATATFQAKESKAAAHAKVTLGGFWLVLHYKGEFLGAPFEGVGTTGYDPNKKKYVSTWTDSMSPSLMLMEGGFDKDGTTYTETGVNAGPDGKPAQMKSVYEFKDADTMVFTMYTVVDGKDQEMFRITYRRKN